MTDLPRGLFAGLPDKIVVIDTCNYHPELRDGRIDVLDRGMPDSEWVARHLGHPVVKAFSWLVLDNYLGFVTDQDEWKGTQITFQIATVEAGTQVRFAHLGLAPEFECFDVCSNAWGSLIIPRTARAIQGHTP